MQFWHLYWVKSCGENIIILYDKEVALKGKAYRDWDCTYIFLHAVDFGVKLWRSFIGYLSAR